MDLSFLKSYLRDHRFIQLATAVEGMEAAIAERAVPNASFMKWKQIINLSVDESVDRLNDILGDHNFDTLVMGAYTLRSALAEATRKGTPRIDLLTKLMSLQDLIQSAKPLIVKRDRKSETAVSVIPTGYMTCQICARSIGATTGLIAYHGYRRPRNSIQTKSCEGANAEPYEASRDRLAHLIEQAVHSERQMLSAMADVEAERVPVRIAIRNLSAPLAYGRKPTQWVRITRDDADEILATLPSDGGIPLATFEDAKARDLHSRRAGIGGIRAHIASLQQRHDGWTKTHRWDPITQGWRLL